MDITDLNERRKALGISLRTLSERSGVSYGSCWGYCCGGRVNRAIMDNYRKVDECLKRLEKERAEKQGEELCRK